MLGNLMAYECRKSFRQIGWSYIAVGLTGVFLLLSWLSSLPPAQSICAALLLLSGLLTVVVSTVAIVRGYAGIFSSEGALMLTLPLPASRLLTAKYLSGILWLTLSQLILLGTVWLAGGAWFGRAALSAALRQTSLTLWGFLLLALLVGNFFFLSVIFTSVSFCSSVFVTKRKPMLPLWLCLAAFALLGVMLLLLNQNIPLSIQPEAEGIFTEFPHIAVDLLSSSPVTMYFGISGIALEILLGGLLWLLNGKLLRHSISL